MKSFLKIKHPEISPHGNTLYKHVAFDIVAIVFGDNFPQAVIIHNAVQTQEFPIGAICLMVIGEWKPLPIGSEILLVQD